MDKILGDGDFMGEWNRLARRGIEGDANRVEDAVPAPRVAPEDKADPFDGGHWNDPDAQATRDARFAETRARREETLRNLKARIEAGEYEVAGDDVAGALLSGQRTPEQLAERDRLARDAMGAEGEMMTVPLAAWAGVLDAIHTLDERVYRLQTLSLVYVVVSLCVFAGAAFTWMGQ